MPPPLFVYGTLRDPDVLALVLGHPVPPGEVLPASAPGHRAVYFPQRTYPALRAEPGATAEGKLLTGLAGTDLHLLDLFEGPEYARGPLDVIVSGQPRRADVYWPAKPVSADAATWLLVEWVARHKAAFLAAEARGVAELRDHLSNLPGGAT